MNSTQMSYPTNRDKRSQFFFSRLPLVVSRLICMSRKIHLFLRENAGAGFRGYFDTLCGVRGCDTVTKACCFREIET